MPLPQCVPVSSGRHGVRKTLTLTCGIYSEERPFKNSSNNLDSLAQTNSPSLTCMALHLSTPTHRSAAPSPIFIRRPFIRHFSPHRLCSLWLPMLTPFSLWGGPPNPSTSFPNSPPQVPPQTHREESRAAAGVKWSVKEGGCICWRDAQTEKDTQTRRQGHSRHAGSPHPHHTAVLAHPQPGTCLPAIFCSSPSSQPSCLYPHPQIRGCKNSAAPGGHCRSPLPRSSRRKRGHLMSNP